VHLSSCLIADPTKRVTAIPRYASLLRQRLAPATTRVTGLLLPFCPKLFIDLYKAGIGGSLGWKAQFTDGEKKLAPRRKHGLIVPRSHDPPV
jgi:hypothetical protein